MTLDSDNFHLKLLRPILTAESLLPHEGTDKERREANVGLGLPGRHQMQDHEAGQRGRGSTVETEDRAGQRTLDSYMPTSCLVGLCPSLPLPLLLSTGG